ncbi:phosphomannomutase [Methylobacterium dankookense]|uniref:Phosphoglucosamine mutase n=1 Tax=Methylobacterium dankookense TaxID=560405 RepID=A0A564FXX3_9HYPH|nr:phosphomannomutase [Methylobacterium dankookense]GJD58425.1 Phosphoglucosamine mutase [Methylobacterium dankookense]VUF12724.1 Phosphoglucosamine mutase [Methylobacterium dankookense]
MSSLKFGTSGLRGLVTDLVGWPSYAYASAFFRSVAAANGDCRTVVVGRDLRDSSMDIAATVANAAAANGFKAIDCGALPTPALALEAMRLRACAIMVTGSHIPEDRNGLKFYLPDGEITKADEAAIIGALGKFEIDGRIMEVPASVETEVSKRYLKRYIDAFSSDALSGLRIAVYQQSSVARDLLTELLAALGAKGVPIGWSATFVPIDTEAHRPEDVDFIRNVMAGGEFDALVTTDGDADRPLVADGKGRIVRGDVLGMLTARYLRIETIVVPVTAGSRLVRAGSFRDVIRTKVGSPFVIAGMEHMKQSGRTSIGGFEANGGFLLGSNIIMSGGILCALPTRDAILPILATLAAARSGSMALDCLVSSLDVGETASDRLSNISSERSGALLKQLSMMPAVRQFLAPIGIPTAINQQDGIRIELNGGRTIHFRASGNAPELRCYAEASTAAEAQGLVSWGLAAAAAAIKSA